MGFSPATWGKIALISALLAATFRYNLIRLWLKTAPFIGEPNWSHSFLVPLVGLYFLFVHREELHAADGKPFVWDRFTRPGRLYSGLVMFAVGTGLHFGASTQAGNLFSLIDSAGEAVAVLGGLVLLLDWSIGITIFGLTVFVYGVYPGQNDYLKDMGMIATLFGIVLLVGGRQIMRIAWFPIVFLVCAIPWPGLVYSWVSTPLSQLAAWVAVQMMQLTGINCGLVGTKIVIQNAGHTTPRVLNVEEACAGLRSLMTYVSMAGAIAFLSSRAMWQKLVIVASAIPIAISCNMLRITVVGELDRFASTNWTDGFAHQFVGLMMLIPAFLLLLILLWVLDRVVIEEADETATGHGSGGGVGRNRDQEGPGGAEEGDRAGHPGNYTGSTSSGDRIDCTDRRAGGDLPGRRTEKTDRTRCPDGRGQIGRGTGRGKTGGSETRRQATGGTRADGANYSGGPRGPRGSRGTGRAQTGRSGDSGDSETCRARRCCSPASGRGCSSKARRRSTPGDTRGSGRTTARHRWHRSPATSRDRSAPARDPGQPGSG